MEFGCCSDTRLRDRMGRVIQRPDLPLNFGGKGWRKIPQRDEVDMELEGGSDKEQGL